MPKKIIQFFATKDDIISVLKSVESCMQLIYVRAGILHEPNILVYHSVDTLPHLGTATNESAINCDCYLVADPATEIMIREVPQLAGGVRYAVDQLQNPRTVTFQPGGFWTEEILLHGRAGTVSEDLFSIQLYMLFSSAIRKKFAKVKSYYVGPEALKVLESGKRLTIAAQSPPDFDLKK